ncbi:MAG: hypothetical protein HY717_11015 [Planctomycetes bacterium]|nr:hypothetical protein [Planctomycetota bacterium]
MKFFFFLAQLSPIALHGEDAPVLRLENDFLRLEVGSSGRCLGFTDKGSGKDYLAREAGGAGAPLARIRLRGREFPATAAAGGDRLTLRFGEAGVIASLSFAAEKKYLTAEVVSLEGPKDGPAVEEFIFLDIPLALRGLLAEPFAGCALALNLKTNVGELPGPAGRLRASCYPRFGFAGAKAAILGCPTEAMRRVMQEAVSAAPELPHSPIGGPWAIEAEINRGSYLFNFGNLTEQTVEDWIRLAQGLGMNQIDFHGGGSFRFGDCEPNRDMYPRGRASLKAVINRLHEAGLKAGLHTYAFFIDKRCPWVTPVPDLRLGKDASFTLAEPLAADGKTVLVAEPTGEMSAVTGFFVRNSAVLQIGDELLIYSGVKKDPPYAFTGCQRGACGTRASAHEKGAEAHHLKECFGLFTATP